MKLPKTPNFDGKTVFNRGTSDGASLGWERRHQAFSYRPGRRPDEKPEREDKDDEEGHETGDGKNTALDWTNMANRSMWPSIFVSNKKMPDSLAKATAVRRGAQALDELKNGTAPIGFTGSVHPLTDVAEHATAAAVNTDDAKSHKKAAEAHEKAAAKMAAFMHEVSPKKHKDHAVKMRGLTSTREHHTKRAEAHKHRAAYLEHQEAKAEEEKASKKK